MKIIVWTDVFSPKATSQCENASSQSNNTSDLSMSHPNTSTPINFKAPYDVRNQIFFGSDNKILAAKKLKDFKCKLTRHESESVKPRLSFRKRDNSTKTDNFIVENMECRENENEGKKPDRVDGLDPNQHLKLETNCVGGLKLNRCNSVPTSRGGSRILERGGSKTEGEARIEGAKRPRIGRSPIRGQSPRWSGGRGLGRGLGEPLPRKFLKIWNDNRAIWCIFGVKFNHFKPMSAAIKSTLISVEWNYKTNIPQSVPSLNRRIISQSHINNPTYRLQCQLELQPCTAARVAGEAFRQQAFSCSMCWGSTDPIHAEWPYVPWLRAAFMYSYESAAGM